MTQTIKLAVSGMTCLHCAGALKGALEAIEGVRDVSVSLPDRCATVRLDPTRVPMEALVRAVEEEGYGAQPAEI